MVPFSFLGRLGNKILRLVLVRKASVVHLLSPLPSLHGCNLSFQSWASPYPRLLSFGVITFVPLISPQILSIMAVPSTLKSIIASSGTRLPRKFSKFSLSLPKISWLTFLLRFFPLLVFTSCVLNCNFSQVCCACGGLLRSVSCQQMPAQHNHLVLFLSVLCCILSFTISSSTYTYRQL
ncbi:hypothetical protein CFOL_v3_29488 [Cephalotus follicularis]|uniref:Uncharacterized protein n=1 Tax=Cephalotus follicularis TaxID=3775 RepID=A0A1Q3D0U1_CEPFO|nr:hypothetical protein CFOL_v3_29488 [Cephalotus follicularis]